MSLQSINILSYCCWLRETITPMTLETGGNVVEPSQHDWLTEPCIHMERLSLQYQEYGLVCIRPPPKEEATAKKVARRLAKFRTRHCYRQRVASYRGGHHIALINEDDPEGSDLSLDDCFVRFSQEPIDKHPSLPPLGSLLDRHDIFAAMMDTQRGGDGESWAWSMEKVEEVEQWIWGRLREGKGALYSAENDGESIEWCSSYQGI